MIFSLESLLVAKTLLIILAKQCCDINGFDSSSNQPFFETLFLILGEYFKCPDYDWYHCHFHVPQLWSKRSRYLSNFSFSFTISLWSAGTTKSTVGSNILLSCKLKPGLVFWFGLEDPFVSQSPKGFCAFRFLLCEYIYQYGENLVSCTVPSGSLCSPSHAWSCITFVLVCNIHIYDCFLFITTYLKLAIFLHNVNFCFDKINTHGFIS